MSLVGYIELVAQLLETNMYKKKREASNTDMQDPRGHFEILDLWLSVLAEASTWLGAICLRGQTATGSHTVGTVMFGPYCDPTRERMKL